jgi:TolB-like protein
MTAVALLTAAYLVSRAARAPTNRRFAQAAEVPRSIAVLPFTNVGGDSSNAPFSDGIADELTTTLGKIDQLNVMARASAFSLAHKGLDTREIGRQLNVQYVLQGSVEAAANRRHVKANLIDVSSGNQIWSQDFENDALNRDVFTVEDSITRSIVRQILPRISPLTLASVVKRQTENRAAHDLYFQGRYLFEKRDARSFTLAAEYFRRAIQIDTSYALAYSGLADVYSHQAVFGYAARGANYRQAKKYAALALAHDSTLVEVHASLAFIALFYDWNWPAAGREFDKAFLLNERYAPVHLFHAWYLIAVDSAGAGIAEGRRAIDLDPFSTLNYARLISFLFYGGRYQEAIDQGRTTFERDSTFPSVRQELARAYLQVGRCREALAVLGERSDPPVGVLLGVRGYTYARCNRRAEALAQLDYVRRLARQGEYGSHYALAVIESGLGDKEQAIAELEKGYVEHAWPMYLIKVDPAFEILRSDPRFVALVRKVGLAS